MFSICAELWFVLCYCYIWPLWSLYSVCIYTLKNAVSLIYLIIDLKVQKYSNQPKNVYLTVVPNHNNCFVPDSMLHAFSLL